MPVCLDPWVIALALLQAVHLNCFKKKKGGGGDGFLCHVIQPVSLLEQGCPSENVIAESALYLTDEVWSLDFWQMAKSSPGFVNPGCQVIWLANG